MAVAVVAVAAVAVVATAGGAAAAVVAVTSVANGVAFGTTATTVAAGAFVGGASALAMGTYAAAVESNSVEEFAEQGEAVMYATVGGSLTGAATAYKMANAQNVSDCFVAGTLICTEDGEIPIEDIHTGDLVWAWDEDTGEVSLKPVVETYINQTDELLHVFVNGEGIVTTPTHPFYSPVKGWTDAVHLRAGDILVHVNGEYVVVEEVQHEILEAPITVYNFQVEGFHTYYVSESGVLVHNTCRNPYGKKGGPKHQSKIDEIAKDLVNRGYDVDLEHMVRTPGGYKGTRYADIFATNGYDSFAIQVGKLTGSGIPVIRERRALADLISAGINVIFVTY